MLSLILFALTLVAISMMANNNDSNNNLPSYSLIVPSSFTRYLHGYIVPNLPQHKTHTTLPKAPRAFMKACNDMSGGKLPDPPKEAPMTQNFWTDAQVEALKAMDQYCATQRKGKEVVGMKTEIFILKKEIMDLLPKTKVVFNSDQALAKQDEWIDNLLERESQKQHTKTDYYRKEFNDFPMDRAERLMFGRVDDACPELCHTVEFTTESQNWALAECKPISENEALARKLEDQGHDEEAKWVREHADLWEETTDKLPVYKFRKEYLRIRQEKLEFIPAKLELRGFEEPEHAQPVRWVKCDGISMWPRLANRPIHMSLGANLLVALVRCKIVNKPSDFNHLMSNIDDIDSNTRSRMWAWFELVTFKRNEPAYKQWKSRQKERNLKSCNQK